MSTWSGSNFRRGLGGGLGKDGWVSRQQKPSRQVSVDEQIQVVLAVVKGESSLAGAARRRGVSPATVPLRIHHARAYLAVEHCD
jgi:hypothetical protein